MPAKKKAAVKKRRPSRSAPIVEAVTIEDLNALIEEIERVKARVADLEFSTLKRDDSPRVNKKYDERLLRASTEPSHNAYTK